MPAIPDHDFHGPLRVVVGVRRLEAQDGVVAVANEFACPVTFFEATGKVSERQGRATHRDGGPGG
ncbi:hypothetical protein E1287_27160 [Actinomadura sp. KC06]|nr:hypothetical protein E1287_27160 [Actinomadura sp. KC06]